MELLFLDVFNNEVFEILFEILGFEYLWELVVSDNRFIVVFF